MAKYLGPFGIHVASVIIEGYYEKNVQLKIAADQINLLKNEKNNYKQKI